MKPLFFLLFSLVVQTILVSAQSPARGGGGRQVMRYKTKQDSIRFIDVQQRIDELVSSSKFKQQTLDSLMNEQSKLFAAAYFVTIYEPRRDYVLAEDLEKFGNLDAVYRVSVYKKTEIPPIVFQCKNLVSLEIISCTLTELPPELNLLHELTTVYVYKNKSRGPLTLHTNKTVRTLEIRTDNPKTLPRSYAKWSGLERLDLSENSLTKFPNGARKNQNLKELSLQRNDLTLHSRIKRHKWLERLAVHGNKIESVPASIKKFENLVKLNLNSNQISTVHDAVGRLKKLEQISFYNNKLNKIPEGVYNLPALLEIDLFHNQIEEVKPAFANWQKLTTLYLSHNKLTSLPENIDTLKFLTGIYVWENRIGKLPERIGKMKQLQFLRINHNFIKEIPESFYQLPNIEEIDFSHNYITELKEAIFNYPNLKIIAIVNNPWTKATAEMIARKTLELRKREVFVHVTEADEN